MARTPKSKDETKTQESTSQAKDTKRYSKKTKQADKKGYRTGQIVEPDYNKSHSEMLLEMCDQGLFDYQICGRWGISRRTFYNWINRHEEFQAAHEIGKLMRFDWWMEHKERVDFKTWSWIMNNMFSELGIISMYNRHQAATTNTQINISNMNVLNAAKNSEELFSSIRTNFPKVSSTNQQKLLETIPELKEIVTLDDINPEYSSPNADQ